MCHLVFYLHIDFTFTAHNRRHIYYFACLGTTGKANILNVLGITITQVVDSRSAVLQARTCDSDEMLPVLG